MIMIESLQESTAFERVFKTSGSKRMNSSINVHCECADDIISKFSLVDVLTTNDDHVVIDVWELRCLDDDNGSDYTMELADLLSQSANCTADVMVKMLDQIHYLKIIA